MVKAPVQEAVVLQWPKDGLFLEHASENGQTFYSKKELQDYCKKNGVSSGALL